jgi:hypothetical protein
MPPSPYSVFLDLKAWLLRNSCDLEDSSVPGAVFNFTTEPGKRNNITLFRKNLEGCSSHELAALAHEAGHFEAMTADIGIFLRYRDIYGKCGYRANGQPIWSRIPTQDKAWIIKEEESAWEFGEWRLRTLAPTLDWDFWGRFEETKRFCLTTYRTTLQQVV